MKQGVLPRCWALGLVSGLFLLHGFIIQAQSPTAGFVGTVHDPSGASVTGAAIRVRNIETNSLREMLTDSQGGFAVAGLPPGSYDVMAEKNGFQTLHETGLVLDVNQTIRLELQLRVGAVSESIEVAAHVPMVNTE